MWCLIRKSGQVTKLGHFFHYEVETTKEISTHLVQAGDSLFLLAQKYQTSINAIKSLNQLKTNMLSICQLLKIPLNIDVQPNCGTIIVCMALSRDSTGIPNK